MRFGDPSGTVHIEGLLIDGPYVADGIGIATGRNVQLQNVRVERAYNNIKGAHADCVQIQQGVGHLRMDRFTCSTDRQGIFLGDHDGAIRSADLRRVNMYGSPGKHLFWQTTPSFDLAVSDVWLGISRDFTAWAPFGFWVYPQRDGKTYGGVVDRRRARRRLSRRKAPVVRRLADQRRRPQVSAGIARVRAGGRGRDGVRVAGLRAPVVLTALGTAPRGQA